MGIKGILKVLDWTTLLWLGLIGLLVWTLDILLGLCYFNISVFHEMFYIGHMTDGGKTVIVIW